MMDGLEEKGIDQ